MRKLLVVLCVVALQYIGIDEVKPALPPVVYTAPVATKESVRPALSAPVYVTMLPSTKQPERSALEPRLRKRSVR
jgi:hypothetical protein